MTRKYTNPPISRLGFIFSYDEIPNWKNRALNFKEQTANDLSEVTFFRKDRNMVKFTSENYEEFKKKVQAFLFRNKTFLFGIDKKSVFCSGMRGFNSFPTYKEVHEAFYKYFPIIGESLIIPLKSIVLTYIDNIYLPCPKHGETDLSEYFSLPVFAPELFNSRLRNCFCQFDLEPPHKKDRFGVSYDTLTLPQKDLIRFQLSWKYIITPENPSEIIDFGNADVQLEEAHTYLRICFENFITDKCRKLFDEPFVNYEEEI